MLSKNKNGKFEAYASNDGQYVSLGTYENENDAINVVNILNKQTE